MICELCKKEHNGTYASGRFCSSWCAKTYSSRIKRPERNKKISERLKGDPRMSSTKGKIYDKSIFKLICEVCGKEFEKKLCPTYYNTKRYFSICNICSRSNDEAKLPDKILLRRKSHKKSADIRYSIQSKLSWDDCSKSEKYRRVFQEQDRKCGICEIIKWCEKNIIFELHHIDGNIKNWSRQNLIYLCPNCHSQTDNFRNSKRI